jgi:hypothetical protein
MAIAFVGSASVSVPGNAADQSISLTSLTGGTRSSVAQDDFVIGSYVNASNSDISLVIEDPSAAAYTLIDSEKYQNSTNDNNFRVAYKFMGATPDASTRFKGLGQSSNNTSIMNVYVFSGVDRTTPIDVTPTSSGGSSILVNPAAITPVTKDATVVSVGGCGHSRGAVTHTASGLTNFVTASANSLFDCSLGIGHIPNWSSGAVDPAAWTFGAADNNQYTYSCITFALRPTPFVGRIKAWSGSAWVPKPVKYWNGSNWITKPIKYWSGSAWVTTTY